MKTVKHPPRGGLIPTTIVTVRYGIARSSKGRSTGRTWPPSLDIEMLEQFLINPPYYRGISGSQEIAVEASEEFLALTVRAHGYKAPDA